MDKEQAVTHRDLIIWDELSSETPLSISQKYKYTCLKNKKKKKEIFRLH